MVVRRRRWEMARRWAGMLRADPRTLPPARAAALAVALQVWQPHSALEVPATAVAAARTAAVDAHNHLGRWLTPDGGWMIPDVGCLLQLMERCNIESIVNLDGRWDWELEANLDRYDRRHRGRFLTFCHVDWRLVRRGRFDELADSLRRSAEQGARGLKVWKDLGLHVRDDAGRLVLPSDPRLSDLWDTAGQLGMPVLIHTADPPAFFEPVDTRNERLEELVIHPDWSLASLRFPRFLDLMRSLDETVAAHPETTFIAAHVCCYAENLRWVSGMLDRHSNLLIDISGRISELGRQPRAAIRLIHQHPERVLFGTDVFPPTAAAYGIHFRFLESADEDFEYGATPVPRQGRWRISGIDVPDDVLRLLYRENALRVLEPRLATAGQPILTRRPASTLWASAAATRTTNSLFAREYRPARRRGSEPSR